MPKNAQNPHQPTYSHLHPGLDTESLGEQARPSQLRAAERDADARSESRPNERRFASDVQSPGLKINLTQFAVPF
jgi:hypothetical protein